MMRSRPERARIAQSSKRNGTEDSQRMGSYLRAVWRCRYFWLSLVKIDLRTRYQRSVLGLGWSLLHPLAMTLVIVVIFRHVLTAGIDPQVLFVCLLAGRCCVDWL